MTRACCRLEIVTQHERLQAIEPAWQALFAADRRATPFQSPDWLLPWAESFAEPGSLRVLVVWSGARALLCLPLRVLTRDGERRLSWLGEGLSDYLDLLSSPAPAGEVSALAWDALRELATEADRVELSDLPSGSPLSNAPQPGWRLLPAAVCPRVDPGSDAGAYQRSLPSWLRRNLRQSERRLAARAPLCWRQARADDACARLEEFFALHRARWRAQGQPGVLDDPLVQAFHRAAAPRLIARGLLQLELASWSGLARAAAYTLVRRRAYLYLTGFDPGIDGVSLGSLVIERAISRAIAEGRRGIDFLRGREAYKYAWGATDTPTLRLLRVSPAAQAACGATGSARPSSC